MRNLLLFIFILSTPSSFSQTKEEINRANENQELLSKASEDLQNGDFASSEAAYRKVIANDPKNTEAKYNLGNAYYAMGKNSESQKRYIQAAEVAQTKEEKHKIYHNLGNVFMNEKQYRPAVEAYKNALRNNPKDDETRYNLALAKEMLEEHGDDGGGGDDQDEEEENEDEKEEGENEEEQDQGGEDNEEEEEQGEEEEDSNESEQDQEGEPQDGQEEGTPEPREGQLSPQQIESLLEAMNNEERKVQEKINAEKQKGVKTKPEKDW